MIEVLYLCNGKNPTCKSSTGCMVDCKHTKNVDYAKNFNYIVQDGLLRNGRRDVTEYFVEEEHNEKH